MNKKDGSELNKRIVYEWNKKDCNELNKNSVLLYVLLPWS